MSMDTRLSCLLPVMVSQSTVGANAQMVPFAYAPPSCFPTPFYSDTFDTIIFIQLNMHIRFYAAISTTLFSFICFFLVDEFILFDSTVSVEAVLCYLSYRFHSLSDIEVLRKLCLERDS